MAQVLAKSCFGSGSFRSSSHHGQGCGGQVPPTASEFVPTGRPFLWQTGVTFILGDYWCCLCTLYRWKSSDSQSPFPKDLFGTALGLIYCTGYLYNSWRPFRPLFLFVYSKGLLVTSFTLHGSAWLVPILIPCLDSIVAHGLWDVCFAAFSVHCVSRTGSMVIWHDVGINKLRWVPCWIPWRQPGSIFLCSNIWFAKGPTCSQITDKPCKLYLFFPRAPAKGSS